MDKAGIYLLIAGSYTPFLVILFPDKPKWSVWLLGFVWAVAAVGIAAALLIPATNPIKPKVSLALYLSMGYSCVLVMQVNALPLFSFMKLCVCAAWSGLLVHVEKLTFLNLIWPCCCSQDARALLPDNAINLVVAGGVMYTAGVPLFVRNRNLDHAIWHLFVLAGSAMHFACIYFNLAEMP